MLDTPLGGLVVALDGKEIEYSYEELKKSETCGDLEGRYRIKLSFLPDEMPHLISCRIKDYTPSEQDIVESGENLELKSFFAGGIKLSLGMEGDTGYYNDGTRLETYDYDTEYFEDGVGYLILPFTKTEEYVFGVAWICGGSEKKEVQTWYGADPTLMKKDVPKVPEDYFGGIDLQC